MKLLSLMGVIFLTGTTLLAAGGVFVATDYGAKGDGVADDTAALSAAASAAAGATLVLPKGTYLTDNLTISGGTTLRGEGLAILKGRTGTSDVLRISSNCNITGVTIDGNNLQKSGIANHNAINFSISNCFISNCLSAGINITGTGGTSLFGHISKNTIQSCGEGIEWWGGDSSASSVIGLWDLTIDNNSVDTATGGGIWGSLGGRITVNGNNVKNCSDVGIDIEGGQNCAIAGNTVYNCTTGGITLFYGSKRISVTGNNVYQDTGYGPAINIKTSTASSFVAISGNCLKVVANKAIATDAMSLTDSVIDGNVIEAGTCMAVRLLDCNKVNTTNNKIYVNASASTGGGTVGISYEGTSKSLISNNTIELTVADASSANVGGGIFLYWRSSTYPCQQNSVTNNAVCGFVTSINDQCWGDAKSWNAIQTNRVETISRKNMAGWSGVIANNISYTNPTVQITATTY